MPDIFYLVSKWWKQMLVITGLTLLIVGIIIFLQPNQYLSVATAVPASSFSADKSKIFSENIEALYSELGTTDDLDMIVGTAKLDTVYLAVTDQFNLFDHYKVSEKGKAARHKATLLLMRNTKVMKSEYGELKVKLWDTDKNLAPQLANAILDKLQAIHQDLQSINNKTSLNGLQKASAKIKVQLDSIQDSAKNDAEMYAARSKGLMDQLQEYEKLISEYQLIIDSKPPVLIVVEKARATDRPDKPRRLQIMIATAVLSFLFALLTALVIERRKTSQ
jgi:uncharacterized protein involved in exopolysaccharide biosynthesis